MKYFAALTCLLLTSIASPSFAVPGNDCAARSEKVKASEREEFMKSCLAQVGSPARVTEAKQRHKAARCEQNAKNMKLQGSEKGTYQADCVNKNEAVIAANSAPKNTMEVARASAPAAQHPTHEREKVSHKAPAKKLAAKKPAKHKKPAKKTERRTASAEL